MNPVETRVPTVIWLELLDEQPDGRESSRLLNSMRLPKSRRRTDAGCDCDNLISPVAVRIFGLSCHRGYDSHFVGACHYLVCGSLLPWQRRHCLTRKTQNHVDDRKSLPLLAVPDPN